MEQEGVKRGKNGQFIKGSAPISPGRPKGVMQKARAAMEKFGCDPFEYLVKILMAENTTNKDKIACCRELLDRGYGRPQSNVNLGDNDIEIKIKKPEKEK